MFERHLHNPDLTAGLEAFRVGTSQVFVIGSLESRVSFISQQARTLTFVKEMSLAYHLQDARILIVGAGIAGTTAATAFAREGSKVTLVERSQKILSEQENAKHRFIHPATYDWAVDPVLRNTPMCRGDRSPLPWPYSWTSGSAHDIVEELRTSFSASCRADVVCQIRVEVNCEIESISRDASSQFLTARVKGKPELTDDLGGFDFVVLAIGFGPEVDQLSDTPPSATLVSYWCPEDALSTTLDQDVTSTFISGRGDGALIDALRAAYGGASFSHSSVLEEFSKNDIFRKFIGVLVLWSESTSCTRAEFADELLAQCDGFWGKHQQECTESWVDLLPPCGPKHGRAHKGTPSDSVLAGTWVLGGTSGSYFLGGRAALLHRVLVWILVKTGYINLLLFDKITAVLQGGQKYTVNFAVGSGSEVQFHFDRVVLRHGPDPMRHLSPLLVGLKDEVDDKPKKLREAELRHLQKFRDVAALRLLPPKLEREICQWGNLGRSVVILPGFPGVRFLAEDAGGPWMMERPVTLATWLQVFSDPTTYSSAELAAVVSEVSCEHAKTFVDKFNEILAGLEDPYKGFTARLPRMTEWFHFAGQDLESKSKYPWGNEPLTPKRAHLANCLDVEPFRYSGRGPWGHIDLLGTVWEWCEYEGNDGEVCMALVGGSLCTDQVDALAPLFVDRDLVATDVGVRLMIIADPHARAQSRRAVGLPV